MSSTGASKRGSIVRIDERGGIPVPPLPEPRPAKHWTLEAIAATERPRQPAVHGEKIAFIVDRDSSDVWVLDPAKDRAPHRLTVDRPLAPFWEDDGPSWSPDGETVAYVNDGAVHLTSGGLARPLCAGSSPAWIDPEHIVVHVEQPVNDRSTLSVVNIDDGRVTPLPDADGDFAEVAVQPTDRLVAAVFHPLADRSASRIHIIDVNSHDVIDVPGPASIHDRGPVWSPDGDTLLFSSEESGWYEVWRWDRASGSRQQVTYDEADFSELAWSSFGLVGVRTRHGVSDLVAIDLDPSLTGHDRVRVIAPGGVWGNPQWTASGDIIATHESPDTPARLMRVDKRDHVHELFAPTPTIVRAAPHVAPEHLWYPAPGGAVPAFLYRPDDASADTPCPVIVHPHGGPTSHYGAEWDGVAQYFVAKGYAWLAPNFKGSTSYGLDHERADHGVWGVDDTADCLAAHEWLSSQDWVDNRRIGIYGASYGSYMALCCAVDSDRYACAVAKYGDCDILTSWAQGDRGGRLDLERMMGHPADNPEGYRAGSPIHRIDNITTPILVAHGEQDIRVHPAQSEELVSALRRIGATYEYVTYPTEAHGFLNRAAFLDFYRRLERFLDWYLL
ncbi:MAG: prolyl oligopeptidase family serine peptidase [Acidimicrobiales bacterium]